MILVASSNDYANLGHNVARSLNAVGIDCIDVCLSHHGLLYESQSNKVARGEIRMLSKIADYVIIMHSCPDVFAYCQPQNYAVYHTGTRYRSNPSRFNKLFKGAKKVLTDQTEFMHFGGMHYVPSAVESFEPKYHNRKTPIIGHYPSNKEVKGSDEIEKALKHHKIDFDYQQLRHSENLKRIENCDIYIELFKPTLNGRQYGCFGVTAIEAGMMGKIVITQDLNKHVYEETYGEHPFLLAEKPSDLPKLVDYAKENLDNLRKKTREIVYKNHTFEATGNRLKQILGL